MRRKTALRVVGLGLLVLCLLGGSALLGASTAGPPKPPPPPPELEPLPEPVYPCILVATWIPPETDDEIEARIPFEPDVGDWVEAGPLYVSGPFKTYINPKFQGANALRNFSQLQQGAFIGLLQAAVPFRFAFKGGERCPPPPVGAARSYDDGNYLLWMAHAPVLGGIFFEVLAMNWFMAMVKCDITPDGKIDIRDVIALAYYPDGKYRSPEEMLKSTRTDEDGGFLIEQPLE